MNGTPLEVAQQNWDALHARSGLILDKAQGEGRGMLASEQREFDKLTADKAALQVAIGEHKQRAEIEARAAAARVQNGVTGPQHSGLQAGYHTGGGTTYFRGATSPSFFGDMLSARSGDANAADRLRSNNAETGLQIRALGNTNATGGSFGEFAPPGYLLDLYATLARAGRVAADRTMKMELPPGVSTVNIPKVLSGSTATVQPTQNTSVSQTDLTSSLLTSGITTVAGKQVFSQQLLDQGGLDIDRIIMADLAADAARSIDLLVLAGTGTGSQVLGMTKVAGLNAVSYTQASPNVAGVGGFYSVLNKAISAVATTRFLPPTAILMHPRRWSWVAASFDAQNRPLVSPTGGQFNGVAEAGGVQGEGYVGTMAGLPVFVDANISTTGGASTSEDYVLVGRFEDVMTWETPPQAATFEAPYSDSMGILARLHVYLACVSSRFPSSLALITGSGLVTPVY